MEQKEPMFFPLDGFEAAIDREHNVVTLVISQVRVRTAPPVQIASMLSAQQAETIANALLEAAKQLRQQGAGGVPRH
ncbi:hypothetical protein [Stenotrophomonas sp. TD3]|uniref:hypothetical protein n=1 Tax=Stenotrophomonas sp. TD3 TaxID=1641707 RepID=UPI000A6A1DD0|nr:hypothetical protein [Stenotrophomonas sp. TD3]